MSAADILHQPLDHASQAGIPSELAGPIVWDRDTLSPDSGLLPVDAACRSELGALAELLRANPLPTLALDAADFEMPASRKLMARARALLDDGPGFVIIDRLPMDDYSDSEAAAIYWILAQMVGRPVAQSWDGKMIYDVRDKGRPPGNGVRPDVTNAEQNFHTDNSYNLCPPDYVALMCVRPAMSGGINSIVSFHSVYNEMRRRHPELLDRLHRPYLFDRQREHAPGDPKVISHPMFEWRDGRLASRLSRFQVINGYALAGETIDPEGKEALECLESIMREPRWNREFFFERGQIQIIDNTRCGHRRTGFVDYPEPERKRHLIRLWLRHRGRRFYNG